MPIGKTMLNPSDKSVAKRTIIMGVNDAFTQSILLKWAILSIYGVARGWDNVVLYKEEMSFSYLLLRYFGFLLMYMYVFELASSSGPL